MLRFTNITMLLALSALPLSGQVDPTDRLSEVLPPDVADQVLERMETARATGLPAHAMAQVALEGVAKGRSGAEVLAAVEALAGDMGRAMAAFEAAGRAPAPGEVESATEAMRMGVDGEAIAELARSQPSGRGLTVPMLVLGGLAQRGLPADQALSTVLERMAQRLDDSGLVGSFPEVGLGMGPGAAQGAPGLGLASSMAGFAVPVTGPAAPMGPPSGVGGRPQNLPGRPGGPPGS